MKFIHVSDLHLGKKLNAYSLLDDQRYYLNKLVDTLIENNIHLLIISGDIFDNYNPSNDALLLFDETLKKLKDNHITSLIITGNHDSSDKVNYLTSFLKDYSIYIRTDLEGFDIPLKIEDVDFYLIPYVSVNDINNKFSTSFKSLEEGYQFLIEKINVSNTRSSVLIAHQTFIPLNDELERSSSEDIVVGAVSNIRASLISKFTYCALGHIHKSQKIAKNAFYSGSPLVFHKDEVNYKKNFLLVDINSTEFSIEYIDFVPYRKVIIINDYFSNLANYKNHENDYIYFVLKDKNIINNAINSIKVIFPYALSIEYEMNNYNEVDFNKFNLSNVENKDINEIFSSFYELQNNEPLDEEQKQIIKQLFIEAKKKDETD